MSRTAIYKKPVEEIPEEQKTVTPTMRLECPSCHTAFNIEAIHRLYRAYLVLTRHSRAASYSVICSICGKHSQSRIRPLRPEEWKCRKCSMKAEREALVGYKQNPLAYKTHLRE